MGKSKYLLIIRCNKCGADIDIEDIYADQPNLQLLEMADDLDFESHTCKKAPAPAPEEKSDA